MVAEGTLPQQYDPIRKQHVTEQDEAGGESADVDAIFDVPVELARALTGFRYDQDPSDERNPWGTRSRGRDDVVLFRAPRTLSDRFV